jgi:hypothetical protein
MGDATAMATPPKRDIFTRPNQCCIVMVYTALVSLRCSTALLFCCCTPGHCAGTLERAARQRGVAERARPPCAKLRGQHSVSARLAAHALSTDYGFPGYYAHLWQRSQAAAAAVPLLM